MSTSFVSHVAAFDEVLGAAPQLVRLVDVDAHEGLVYVADEDALYFTTVPRETGVPGPGFPVVDIKRLVLGTGAVELVRANANAANGMTLDRDGRLLVCEQGTPASHGRITALDLATGDVEPVVDNWRSKPRAADAGCPARRRVPDRGLRHQRAHLGVAAQLHLDAHGDARLLRSRARRCRPGGRARVCALDAIVPIDAKLEKVAGGFEFTEGPVWTRDGALLFSSPNTNAIYRWTPAGAVTVFRSKSGYTGLDIGRYHQPGSNGLTFDPQNGLLTMCQHGDRRIVRVNPHGDTTVLADSYEGMRLNSPNDLVYRSDGTLYFTDPPFGLPGVFDDPAKETPFSGIYRVRDGIVSLESDELVGPNGLAFSPDERYLYVGNWDPERKIVMRYEAGEDGALSNGSVFYDMTDAPGEDALDGIKVDEASNLYVCGPGGLWVLSPAGERLGLLKLPEDPHNLAWGDADGRTLYIAALTSIYRIRLGIAGIRPT